VFGFIFVTNLTLLSPFCTLCLTPLLGIGVGYLSGWLDTPTEAKRSLLRGGIAGGVSGIAAVAGQMLATVVFGILVTNSERLPNLARESGLSEFFITDPNEYWEATLLFGTFCSAFNLLIIAGLGAVGGLIWFQQRQKHLLAAGSM
jgi:hypothetical protein